MPRSKAKPNEARKHVFSVRFSDDELKLINAYLAAKDIRIKRKFFRECVMKVIVDDAKDTTLNRFGKFPPSEFSKATAKEHKTKTPLH